MMKKLYTFLVLVLFLPLSTMAQMHYPIRTNTIVTPPVPFSLDGFVSQPGKLMLNVLVDDVTLSQYPVKLQLHIEGNGIRISSNPNIPQQPIYLDGGVTTQLTGSDLEFYFNPENLLFQGYSLNEYRRNGRLPEGVYRIRFEVLDFYRDFKVSSAMPAVAMMSLTNGPVLTFPANRSEIDVDANPVLRFSWMAVFTAIPDALIEYRFKLWQIRPDNRDPFEITKVTTPVYEVDLSETALLYDGSLPPLEKGARYVWQVTALDLSGNVLFKKDGNSDIATFRYGYECAAPSAVISKVSHNSVSVSWNSNSSIREYIVSYRKENDSEWQEVTTSNVGLTIDNLEHSVQYELYVRASCGDASSSNERLLRFKTDRFVDYSCGAGAPRISFENQDPLPALHRFDEFKAADFYIEVTEVSGSQGVFSGRGLASIPFLEFLKFEVSFNDITINTDRQMIDGHVVFLHEEETGKIPGRNMGVGGSQGAEGSQELSFEEALNEIADQKVTIDEEVADVSVSNGNVTVVTESGQTQSYLVGENQILAIVTPESIVVVDQASGQVFQAPNTPPGSSSNVRTPSQSGIHGCLVTFRPSATQRLGFDAVGNGVVKPNSYFLRDRNGDAVPWKSLEAGNTDYVAMLTNGDCQADSLRFIRESGLLTPTTPGRNNSLELLLTGGFQGQEERLTVARATTNHINDSTSEEILTEAGVLGLVSYQRITRDVFLIPVNGASFPTASTQLSDIEKRLNEIYGSAVINWNVHFDEPIEVGRINEADFKVEGTSMLSKYTSDMNRVIRTYKRNRPSDDNSLYLFFVELSDLGTSRKGFMPLAGYFGFIFNFSASDFDLLAHELAHGAFNLRHTFSDKAQHYFPVQQTANLMDYAGGTDLWKYQWDLIHDPERVLFAWAQDEEEGAMMLNLRFINFENEGVSIHYEMLDENKHLSYITPSGKPYVLPQSYQPTFTGSISENEARDVLGIPRGVLLGFKDPQGRNWLANFTKKGDGTFYFNGYKNSEEIKAIKLPSGPVYYVIIGIENNECRLQVSSDRFYYDISETENFTGEGEIIKGSELSLTTEARLLKAIALTEGCFADHWLELPEIDYDIFSNEVKARYNYYGYGGVLCLLSDGHYYYHNINEEGNDFYMLWNGIKWEYWTPPNPDCLSCELRELLTYRSLLLLLRGSGHDVLDGIGMIPVFGEVADVINAGWYLIEGDYVNAGLSGISIIPFIGDYAGKSIKYVERIGNTIRITEISGEKLKVFKSVGNKIAKTSNSITDIEGAFKNLGRIVNNATDLDNLEYLTNNISPTEFERFLTKINNFDAAKQSSCLNDLAYALKQADGNSLSPVDGLVDAWKVLDDAAVPQTLRTDPDKLTKVNRYLDNNSTKKDVFIDDLRKTSEPDKFVDRTSWKDDLVQQYGDDINQFKPQGLEVADVPESIYKDMFAASNAPNDFKAQAIADAIKSGSTAPVKETTSIGDRLYKVVPKGEGVTGYSPFWIKKSQLDEAISSGNMEQVLGLPLGSHSVHYDVLEISAIENGVIFNNKIAPTLQNVFETTGGSIQSLVLDRTLWSNPEVIRTIMP